MVTTRGHPGSEEYEQLGETGKVKQPYAYMHVHLNLDTDQDVQLTVPCFASKQQATKQEGPIAKKSKTVPLQEADKELEEGQEKMFAKASLCVDVCVWMFMCGCSFRGWNRSAHSCIL